jgi:hypothetical protein
MFHRAGSAILFAVSFSALCWSAQSGQAALQSYFVGRQVRLKIDMPGTARGVDLRVDAGDPMDWKQYSSRLKESGPAIRGGDRATVTTIVVKKNLIEFQLDGGGFGTFWDDSSTTVTPYHVGKSDYEKRLEREIRDTSDEKRKRELQRELDRERYRCDREQAADNRAAMIASQMKQQQVADKRMRGGSRFNLRWAGNIPADQLTPDALMKLLATYIDFDDLQAEKPIFSPNPTPAAQNAAAPNALANGGPRSPMTQLKRGMLIGEVSGLLGLGRQMSQSVSEEGLKTQIFEYLPDDYRVEVTYVDGVVVRYSISSR